MTINNIKITGLELASILWSGSFMIYDTSMMFVSENLLLHGACATFQTIMFLFFCFIVAKKNGATFKIKFTDS